MPELPEVETVRRGLAAALSGQRIEGVTVRRTDLRVPVPLDLGQRLVGRQIAAFDRRGKYLLVRLDDGQVLIVHLGMSGRLSIDPDRADGPHDHIVFHFEGGATASFTDHRRFGLVTICEQDAVGSHPLLAEMGPEPLDVGFTGPALAARLRGRHTPIKAALLDQRTVAGLGNIYVCEALYRARLSPRRLAHTVGGVRAAKLVTAIRDVLNDAIAAGGSSLRDYAQASGELGYFQHRFSVYDREGEPCPGCDCAAGVRRIVQSNRSTYYCAKRQR